MRLETQFSTNSPGKVGKGGKNNEKKFNDIIGRPTEIILSHSVLVRRLA